MNREIKFRAWGGWMEDEMKTIYSDDFETLERFFAESQKFEGLMQYTGLKDKNGKEIYEGDVVIFDEDVCRVGFGWCSTGMGDEYPAYGYYVTRKKYNQLLIGPDDCEVIGNIYENPELLEVRK